MTEYRKRDNSYYAISDKPTLDSYGDYERPYAEVTAYHKPAKFIVPYPNNVDDKVNWFDIDEVTGLSSDYLKETENKIRSKGEDNLTGHDEDFLNVLSGLSHPYQDARQRGAEEYKKATQEWNNPHFQPDKLFEHKPSSMEIDTLTSHPTMRASAMNLIAVAKRDLGAETIQAPESLSRHSSRLVKKAKESGLPVKTHPDNPDADVSNYMDFENQTIPESDLPFGKKVSPEVVAGGKQDLREMLRGRRQQPVRNAQPVTSKGLSAQFLPGMEGFV